MAGWVLCMTLVLAALAGVLGETRYDKFKRQHVDNPRTLIGHRYCETMMARRGMLTPGGPCKRENTFVHAPGADLVAACYRAPIPNTNLYSTSIAMHITSCRRHSGYTWPRCSYTAHQLQHRVLVGCQNRRPVHLENTFP